MGINITLRRLDFPEWVDKAYEDLSPQDKEDIIKAMIYTQITPLESKNEEDNNEFEISKLLQSGANRVPVLDGISHCLWALNMAMVSLAWGKMDERKEVKIKEEDVEVEREELTNDKDV